MGGLSTVVDITSSRDFWQLLASCCKLESCLFWILGSSSSDPLSIWILDSCLGWILDSSSFWMLIDEILPLSSLTWLLMLNFSVFTKPLEVEDMLLLEDFLTSSSAWLLTFAFSGFSKLFELTDVFLPAEINQLSLQSGPFEGISKFSELDSELRDFFLNQEGSWLKSGLNSVTPGSLFSLFDDCWRFFSWKLK